MSNPFVSFSPTTTHEHTIGTSVDDKNTTLGVQLFNVVITTPRLIYGLFGIAFIIVNLLVTSGGL